MDLFVGDLLSASGSRIFLNNGSENDVHFIDTQTGWVVGHGWSLGGTILHTGDGGQTWVGQNTENGGGSAVAAVDGDGLPGGAPQRVSVSGPYPNPFNPMTRFRFVVPGVASQAVEVTIHDLQGRLVRMLIAGERQPGEHEAVWDGLCDRGEPVPSGMYLYSVTIGTFETSGKLTLLK